MNGPTLSAERRTLLGKKVKQLRRAGRLPGIVYGPAVQETVPVTVDRRQFDRFYQAAGTSTLFTLRWTEGQQAVFIREIQRDPVRRQPLHIDFFAPRLDQPTRATVPVVLHNLPTHGDGVLTQTRAEAEVEALPAAIPHQLEVDASGLTSVGDVLRIGDIVPPAGVTIVTAADEVVAQVSAEAAERAEAAEAEGVEAAPEAAAAAPEREGEQTGTGSGDKSA